jgi:hypothetical protein
MTDEPNLEQRITEPQFRSRGEEKVAGMLDRYHIPFVYEMPTIIFDRNRHHVWRPDFTLPEHNYLILEYAGMMDIPDYAKGIEHKRRAFRRNHKPAVFIYPHQIRARDWERKLYERIEYAAQQPYLDGPAGYLPKLEY